MVKKIAENFNRLSRAHQRHRQADDRQTTDDRRQTTDGLAIAYSEREREFTSAKNESIKHFIPESILNTKYKIWHKKR